MILLECLPLVGVLLLNSRHIDNLFGDQEPGGIFYLTAVFCPGIVKKLPQPLELGVFNRRRVPNRSKPVAKWLVEVRGNQKLYFRAIWIRRGSSALLMVAVETVRRFELGWSKCGVLVKLKLSKRNCKR